jgi:hypothetical protein
VVVVGISVLDSTVDSVLLVDGSTMRDEVDVSSMEACEVVSVVITGSVVVTVVENSSEVGVTVVGIGDDSVTDDDDSIGVGVGLSEGDSTGDESVGEIVDSVVAMKDVCSIDDTYSLSVCDGSCVITSVKVIVGVTSSEIVGDADGVSPV